MRAPRLKCSRSKRAGTLCAEQVSCTQLRTRQSFAALSPCSHLPSQPKCCSLGRKRRCQQLPIPCKASGREGWEGTSKDRLRQGYNRRDGTVAGTLSWDGGGFFSPRASPQSSPQFCDSENSALPARAKESSGVQGTRMTSSVQALQMGGHKKGREG